VLEANYAFIGLSGIFSTLIPWNT